MQKWENPSPIIVALEAKTEQELPVRFEEVEPLLPQLGKLHCICKIAGLVITHGVEVMRTKVRPHVEVMVDLKYHDTPDTVRDECARLLPLDPWAVTIHASGGIAMIRSAVEMFANTRTKVFAVTLLTSLGDDCNIIYHQLPSSQVRTLAEIAYECGVDGVVCSPKEVGILRQRYYRSKPEWWNRVQRFVWSTHTMGIMREEGMHLPSWKKARPRDMMLIAPAVSIDGTPRDDQRRTGTLGEIFKEGADYAVIGRGIMRAEDESPVEKLHQLLQKSKVSSV